MSSFLDRECSVLDIDCKKGFGSGMFASRLRLTTATGGSSLFLSSLMWATSEGVGLARSEFVLDIEAVRRGCVKLFREVAVP